MAANLIDIRSRPPRRDGLSIDEVRAIAQREADQAGADIAIGWQLNDTTGEKELGWCPAAVAPSNAFVIEVLEVIRPYRGGRAGYAEHVELRRVRLESAADRARAESSRRCSAAHAAIDGIPPGQPILVGHHSERRHRAALDKHDRNMRAAIDADKAAAELAARADAVGGGGISSDDPEALAKLRARLVELETRQEHMKAANRVIRRNKGDPATCVAALQAQGFTEAQAQALLKPDYMGRIGFADYAVKNNNANARRIRERIAVLERQAAETCEGEQARSRGGVVYRIEDNRVQLVFPGKPEERVRDRLKSSGFRWSPTAGAWQRQLSNAGKYWAGEFITWLDSQES